MANGLQDLMERGILERHRRQPDEIKHLWSVAVRDLAEAGIPEDGSPHDRQRRFDLAYQAAAKLCLAMMYAEGCRPARGAGMLAKVSAVLPCILGPMHAASSEYLNTAETRRSKAGAAGRLTVREVEDLVLFSRRLAALAMEWMQEHHPDLLVEQAG